MRLLFEMDKKDYKENGTVGIRPSVRGIIVKDKKIAMIYSKKYNYYKFPGGGALAGEQQIDTLIREVKEESGLCVIRNSVREYGFVHRVQKGIKEDIFIQDNYYYLCDAEEDIGSQQLDAYEKEEQFTLEFVIPNHAIYVNRRMEHGEKQGIPQFEGMLEREARVLELLVQEGLIL